MPVLTEALRLAALGYPVFPLAAGTKVPLRDTNGCLDAAADEETVRAMWAAFPDANVGVATAGLLLVDVDGTADPWADAPENWHDLLCAPQSRTPSGGRHLWFRQPDGAGWRNTAKKIAANVDTRADGGYVVAPPSATDKGTYAWAAGNALDVPPAALPLPPDWLARLVGTVAERGTPVPAAERGDGPIPEGRRNATLASMAGGLRRVGFGESEIFAALVKVNADRCRPQLPATELAKIAKSALRYQPDPIASTPPMSDADMDRLTVHGEVASPFAPKPPKRKRTGKATRRPEPIPAELLDCPGLVGEVAAYSESVAHYPNRPLAFAGALALMAHLCGRLVRDPGNARPNLYVLALADSGAGKDHPRQVNVGLLAHAGAAAEVAERIASGEGLEDALLQSPRILFQTDEIDGMMRAINGSRDARHESILNMLLTLYSRSASVHPLRRKAGQPGLQVVGPSVTVLGSAIPTHFYESLSERMLTNGFFARCLVLAGAPRGARGTGQWAAPPSDVSETVRWWCDRAAAQGDDHPETVARSHEAESLHVAALDRFDGLYAECREAGDDAGMTLWARAGEHMSKLALVRACSEFPNCPEIDADAVRWSAALAEASVRSMVADAADAAPATQGGDACSRLLRKIAACPDGIDRRSLLKRSKMLAGDFAKVLGTLVDRGDVEENRIKNPKGRTTIMVHISADDATI